MARPTPSAAVPADRPALFYGWVIVGVCFLAQFSGTIASSYGLTVLLVPMSQELGWSRTAIVAVAIPASLSATIASPFLGRIANRYGARVPMSVTAVVGGLSIMSIAWVQHLWVYYVVFGLLNGLTRPMVQVIGVSSGVAEWFVRRRALAASIVSVANPISGLVGISLASFFVLHFGWRATWVALGAMSILLVAVPTAIFWRTRPEDMGLRPDGDPAPLDGADEASGSAARHLPRTSRWAPYRSPIDWTPSEAVRTRSFWVIAIVPALIALGGPTFALHVVAFFLSKGLSTEAAAAASTSFVLGTLIGRFFWGFLGGRLHVQYCYVVLGGISVVSTALILVASTFAAAYASMMFFGVAAGGLNQLRLQIWPDYFGRRHISTLRGYTAPFELLGATVGPLLAAWVFDTTGSYGWALGVFAILSAAGLVAMLTIGGPPPDAARHPATA